MLAGMWFMNMVLPLVGTAAVLLTPRGAAAQQAPAGPATIRVSAEASVSAKPDMGVLDLGVVSEAKTADAAAADNARKMERLVAGVKKELGAAGDVKTTEYNVEQRYGRVTTPDQRPPITGYSVTNTIRVHIHDITAVGRVIDQALKLGANEVRSLSLTLRDAEPLRAEALKAASAKAKARAAVIAGALGLRLGVLVSASDTDEPGRPGPLMMERKAVAFSAATPVEMGTLEVAASVTLVFATAAR
jgi:uncharacterized protein YggE